MVEKQSINPFLAPIAPLGKTIIKTDKTATKITKKTLLNRTINVPPIISPIEYMTTKLGQMIKAFKGCIESSDFAYFVNRKLYEVWILGKKLRTDQQEKREKMRLFSTEEISAATKTVMTITGNNEISIDGCRGVIDYYDNLIKIKVIKGAVVFSGNGLMLTEFSDGGAIIRGNIETIEFVAR